MWNWALWPAEWLSQFSVRRKKEVLLLYIFICGHVAITPLQERKRSMDKTEVARLINVAIVQSSVKVHRFVCLCQYNLFSPEIGKLLILILRKYVITLSRAATVWDAQVQVVYPHTTVRMASNDLHLISTCMWVHLKSLHSCENLRDRRCVCETPSSICFFGVEFASCTHGQIHCATGSSHENKFIYAFFFLNEKFDSIFS